MHIVEQNLVAMVNGQHDLVTSMNLSLPSTMRKSLSTAYGNIVVKALCYKPTGGGFDSRWCHWKFSLT